MVIIERLPVDGECIVLNPPGHPAHVYDLVGVHGVEGAVARTSLVRTLWRLPVDAFSGWGRPVLAPIEGVVHTAHDKEPDRPTVSAVRDLVNGFLVRPLRHGRNVPAMAGNHVIIEVGEHPGPAEQRGRRVAARLVRAPFIGRRLGAGQRCASPTTDPSPHSALNRPPAARSPTDVRKFPATTVVVLYSVVMAAKKLSVSFEAELADAVREAAANEGVSLSTWLASAAAAKARQRHLRAALDEFAQDVGALSDEDIDRLISAARQRSVVVQPRRSAA